MAKCCNKVLIQIPVAVGGVCRSCSHFSAHWETLWLLLARIMETSREEGEDLIAYSWEGLMLLLCLIYAVVLMTIPATRGGRDES